MFLISARRLVMLYICAKFHEIILNGIKVIERTRFLYGKLQRGITPQNKYRWSNRCLSLHIVWSCFIFLKVIEWTQFLYGKLQRGIIPPKMQVEQLLLISACHLSCFIFLPSFVKLSQTVSKLQSRHNF